MRRMISLLAMMAIMAASAMPAFAVSENANYCIADPVTYSNQLGRNLELPGLGGKTNAQIARNGNIGPAASYCGTHR
jgi:hypothetical protein